MEEKVKNKNWKRVEHVISFAHRFSVVARRLVRGVSVPTFGTATSGIATIEDIRCAYRLLLGRAPDEAGLRFHVGLVRKRRLSASELAELFITSEEYQGRKLASAELEELRVQGFSLFLRRNDRLIGQAIRGAGDYEPWVRSHFLSAVAPGNTVLDIGANVGFFSMLASRAVGPEGCVISVEPLARNLRSLYLAVEANDARNVRVLPVAASDTQSLVRIACENDSSNGVIVPGIRGGELIQACPLDEWLPTLSRLDVIKIDVEGHEPRALCGLRNTLAKFKPVLFAEFGPLGVKNHSGVEPAAFASWFTEYGSIDVLRRDGTTVATPTEGALLAEWTAANERTGMGGLLHLDIRVRPKP